MGSKGVFDLKGRYELLTCGSHLAPIAIFRRNAREPEHGETRNGKREEEGHDEEAGIEMPAPDSPIESVVRHSILLRN